MDTPILHTSRLVLRPLALTDAPAIPRHFNNWNIIKNLASVVPWPYPEDGAVSFIRHQLDKITASEQSYHWVLALQSGDGQAIGSISFRPQPESLKGNRGFWLAEPYWNLGLMTEAIEAVNDFVFNILDIESFYVLNAPSNLWLAPGQAEDRRGICRLRRSSASQRRAESRKMEGHLCEVAGKIPIYRHASQGVRPSLRIGCDCAGTAAASCAAPDASRTGEIASDREPRWSAPPPSRASAHRQS